MKLCVALDLDSYDKCIALADELNGLDVWLKVGLRSYLRDGYKLISKLKDMGFKIFLDLKFYDIPNTMADACEEVAMLGVDMINLHASAGRRAMHEVMSRLNARFSQPCNSLMCSDTRPIVLAVSSLTSFNNDEFKSIYRQDIQEAVKNMSMDAYNEGLDGMVCSVYESKLIKSVTNDSFLTLTPGIRPFGESAGDQSRVANLQTAKEYNSDFIVVGRPIYQSLNPRDITEKILSEIK